MNETVSDMPWSLLTAEMDAWAQAGKRARFWLRDDDAAVPTMPLNRLLALTAEHAVPLTLAISPALTGQPLADHLGRSGHVEVTQHGYAHDNHAAAPEKKMELGLHRGFRAVLDDLEGGLRHLERLHGARFVPVLVPPWNRIAPELIDDLPPLGFKGLSVFGPEKDLAIPVINTHVDVIDWRGTRGGRDPGVLVAEIIQRLRTVRETGQTVGLLTHHLDHDEAAWDFIARLLAVTSGHPGCRWCPIGEVLAEPVAA